MRLIEQPSTCTSQPSVLTGETKQSPLTVSKPFYIWTTPDQGCQTPLPLQVLNILETESTELFQTQQGLISADVVTHTEEELSGVRLLAHQYLITAVLNQELTEGGVAYSQIPAKELKILTGYQQSLLQWYLLRHPEVQDVWLLEKNKGWKLGIKFRFFKKEA